MKVSFFAFTLLLFRSFLTAGTDPQECMVADEEEYAVIAAVLFPNEPDIPEGMTDPLRQDAYREFGRVHLDGFHGSSYLILDASMEAETIEDTDPNLAEDFNRKNRQSCRFDEGKLQDLLGEHNSVRLIGAEAAAKRRSVSTVDFPGLKEFENESVSSRELVRISRPGFNASRTCAVVDVDLQAGPEMGVGYRAYLEKSPITGKWILAGAYRTRIY